MGADVIKVEDTGVGDYARSLPPMVGEVSAMFHVMNRGKRSLSVDLKSDEGRELALQLVESADVVIEQFRPGVMQRLGLDFDALQAVNPKVILCSLTGYGQEGPMADLAGHDLNYQALAGTLWMEGEAGRGPIVPGLPTADLYGAMAAVTAVLGALLRREREGSGCWIDLSISDVIAGIGAPLLAGWTQEAESAPGRGESTLDGGIAHYSTYRTRDGKYLAVAALEPKFFARFAELVGHPEWLQVLPLPGQHQVPLRQSIAEVVAEHTRDEWVQLLDGVDCCVTPVLDPAEAAAHPHYAARGLVGHAPQGQGSAAWVNSPLGTASNKNPPLQGQHSDEILAELGIDSELVAGLRSRGVIR